jgi:hypothetical protein
MLIADLVTVGGVQRVYVESLSSHGAGLRVDDLPGVGSEVVLAWSAYDIPGTVAWAEGHRCGVAFSRTVPTAIAEEIIRTSGGGYTRNLAFTAKPGSFSRLGKI